VTIFAIFASHKFAGPIYRFERSARAVGSGDLTHRVQIRTGDEMEGFQDEFNLMVESLQRMISQDAHISMRVSKHLNELLNDRHVTGDLHNRLQQIKGDADQLHKGFKL
jgi:methyl-accepting chemotaxis protein